MESFRNRLEKYLQRAGHGAVVLLAETSGVSVRTIARLRHAHTPNATTRKAITDAIDKLESDSDNTHAREAAPPYPESEPGVFKVPSLDHVVRIEARARRVAAAGGSKAPLDSATRLKDRLEELADHESELWALLRKANRELQLAEEAMQRQRGPEF